MVSHQDKALGVEQRSQTYRLTDLRRLIHDAEVKVSAAENWVLHTHTGGGHNKLQEKKKVIFKMINNLHNVKQSFSHYPSHVIHYNSKVWGQTRKCRYFLL